MINQPPPPPANKSGQLLSTNLSVYLDVLRLIAAFAVLLGHARALVMPGMPISITNHGREAVGIFFVLSGLVISLVVREKEKNWKSYLVARLARLYSVILPALLLTFILDFAGARLNPEFYAQHHPISLSALLSVLSFTNELWFSHIVYGTNGPYWSLGFEVWYYIAFGVYCYARPRFRYVTILLLIALAGPKIMLYFPLWLLGVRIYGTVMAMDNSIHSAAKRRMALVCWAATVPLYLVLRKLLGSSIISMYQWGSLQEELISFAYFHLLGLLVAVNILAFSCWVGQRTLWPDYARHAIRWLAGASFTLYLTHEPVLAAIRAHFPSVIDSRLNGMIAIAATLVAALLMAEMGERRKHVFTSLFKKIVR